MKTIDSFAFLADTILGGLETVSRVDIDCTIVNPDENPQTPGNLQIKAVNGQHSAYHYLHFLKHLRAETIENLRETIPQVAPGDMETFIDYLLRRIRMISRAVYFSGFSHPGEQQGQMLAWSVRHVNLQCNGKNTYQPEIVDDALAKTRRHAWIFYLVVKKLEDRVNCCAGATLNISWVFPTKPRNPVYRFRLTCTVAFLGALLRVLCDRNIVENPNVSELCRRIANSVCTGRQELLSPRGVRNCFDNPTPETLEKLLEELKICVKYTEKFIQRQRL